MEQEEERFFLLTLEQAKAEQEKVQREIRQLENRQKILLNKQADAERRARTRRLIGGEFEKSRREAGKGTAQSDAEKRRS